MYFSAGLGLGYEREMESFELAQAQCYSGEESKLEGYASEIRSLSHSTATLKAGASTKKWLVGWLMAWDVLVDIADVKKRNVGSIFLG